MGTPNLKAFLYAFVWINIGNNVGRVKHKIINIRINKSQTAKKIISLWKVYLNFCLVVNAMPKILTKMPIEAIIDDTMPLI